MVGIGLCLRRVLGLPGGFDSALPPLCRGAFLVTRLDLRLTVAFLLLDYDCCFYYHSQYVLGIFAAILRMLVLLPRTRMK